MKATVEKIENSQQLLEVEVEPQKLEDAVNSTYKKMVGKHNIPGFRKGKAPRAIFEQFVGTEYLYQEAADEVLSVAYQTALIQNKIEPIDRPEIEIVQLEPGKPFIFRAKVTVIPEVVLGQYKELEITRHIFEITDQQVDNQLKSLQEQHARLATLDEGEVTYGDVAVIDFEGFLDGTPFDGGKGEGYPLEIGSGSFIPGFEDQLIGVEVGAEKEIELTFPENYHGEDVAGKDVVFKVKVNSIRRKELSELDDEFAQDVSEFDTLAELKADTKSKLEEQGRNQAEMWLKEQAVTKAGENATVEIPQVLIERQIDLMLDELSRNMQAQGLSLDQYFAYTGTTMEALRQEYSGGAKKSVLSELVLETIADEEKIEVSEEEIEKEYEKMAKNFNQDIVEIKKTFANAGQTEPLKHNIRLDKTVDFLVAEAIITEEKEIATETETEEQGEQTENNLTEE